MFSGVGGLDCYTGTNCPPNSRELRVSNREMMSENKTHFKNWANRILGMKKVDRRKEHRCTVVPLLYWSSMKTSFRELKG